MPRQAEDDAGAPTRQLPLPPWGSLVDRARGESTVDRAIGREGSVVIGDAISPSTQQF